MIPVHDPISLLKNSLFELRVRSFERIVWLIGLLCYVGLMYSLWPQTTFQAHRYLIGLMSCLMLVVLVLTYALRRRYLGEASFCLLTGIMAVITLLVTLTDNPQFAYLLVVPLAFSSILLGQNGSAAVVGISLLLLGVMSQTEVGGENLFAPLILSTLMIAVIFITTRHLYTALTWALNGYDSAVSNQNLARNRKADLEQVLKSLDIATTNLQRANHALELAREQADEARELKQHFAQTISHELRTPLNLIVGFTESIMMSPEYYGGPLPQRYLRDLSIVYRNANHLQSLVNDVLDLARIESAQMTIKLEWTTLTDLLAEMTQTARSLVEKRHLTFEVNVQESLPQVMIDPIRVRQILFNLLSNAVRFTDQGKISLIVEERDNALQFHVRDTGIGIRSEDQKHIFAPFRQANGGLNQRGGAGLGLTISQQLAQLHGGDIRVESVFGKGSTFTFHLPLQQAAPLSQRNSDVAAIASRIDPKNQLALVVTQSPTATAMFTRHLSDYRVINATSFEQAKTLATQLLPQLVVIDSFMRSMEAETLHELAQDWQLFNAYMIACPLPGEDALRQQLNAQAYMMKPVARERLEDVLQQFGDDIRRILIVDNDRDFVQLIERMLHNPLRKFDLISTYGGKEALDWLKSNPSPDLILLDLEMPDMNGQEVLRHLRTLPNGEQLKVVIVSALEILPTATQVSGNLTVTRPAGATTTDLLKWIHGVVRG